MQHFARKCLKARQLGAERRVVQPNGDNNMIRPSRAPRMRNAPPGPIRAQLLYAGAELRGQPEMTGIGFEILHHIQA